MKKTTSCLRDSTADALLLTPYARSIDSQKPCPIINDEYATKLVEQIDYDFRIFDYIPTTSVGVALRSVHFDKVTSDFISSHKNPIIVIVGCGLDTRKQRLNKISEQAFFYQLDLPEVISLREQLLPPTTNEKYISGCLLEPEWKDMLLNSHPDGEFIFLVEGVLMYFTEDENRQFFVQLAERFHGAELHVDMFNYWMSQNTAFHEGVSRTQATFKFGVNNEKQIANWHDDLQHEQTWLLSDYPDWHRMGLPFVSLYLAYYAVRTAVKFIKFTIK
ncbi:MAG: class I SAM-dependent methyltransferase [Alcaligenaceae bacterium]|nr:class I SAM-dependent methyltransferase [Alcaligenaceae bacterium]